MTLIPNKTTRRIFLDRHGLLRPQSGSGRSADLQAVITDLGFVQLDSVNTMARAHDLILWTRRQQYRPAHLDPLQRRDRVMFEHWTHDAAMIPMEFYPHWHLKFARDEAYMRRRWTKWQGDFAHKFDPILDHIAKHGPCGSADLADERSEKSTGWWDWHPGKAALEFLWRSGRLAVSHREGFRKIYDLAENVIPADLRQNIPDPQATIDWACNGALDRLGFATSGELAAFWDIVTPDEARVWTKSALALGDIIEVDIEGADGKLRRSFARPDLVNETPAPPSNRLRILSPFDPALRDRKRAERLFGFHYRIEIFVPAAKRKYGYYVFPILEGDRLIGRIDAKAQRNRDRLRVTGLWPEPGTKWGKTRQSRLESELNRLLHLSGCARISFANGWLKIN